jgi:hypothetical protein
MLRFYENGVLSNNFRPKRDHVTGQWIIYIITNFMICTLHQNYSGNHIKKDEVSGSCDMSGGQEKLMQKGLWWG